jgi:hypothetical protein
MTFKNGERIRKTVSLVRCATRSLARLRLREYIERAGINPMNTLGQVPVPGPVAQTLSLSIL